MIARRCVQIDVVADLCTVGRWLIASTRRNVSRRQIRDLCIPSLVDSDIVIYYCTQG